MKRAMLLAPVVVATVLLAQAQGVPTAPALPPAAPLPVALPVLIEAAQTALATCRASGWPVSLTILDADATMRLQLRDEGAGAGTVAVSYRKAYTVVKTGLSTEDYAKALAPEDIVVAPRPPGATGPGGGEPTVRNADPLFLPRAGGLPIMLNGKLVGAMAISGRPRGGDVDCVKAGLAKIAAAR
jgi:uncharacterized protein GlcG (DUF336 family)